MTTKKPPRLNLADAVQDLAPQHPPCFPGREMWVQYLLSAAAAQSGRNEPKVILIQSDGKGLFNTEFPMCTDCSPKRSAQMQEADRCNPAHLRQLEKEKSE